MLKAAKSNFWIAQLPAPSKKFDFAEKVELLDRTTPRPPNAWTTKARNATKARSTKHAKPKRAPAGSQPFALRGFRVTSCLRDPERRACAIQHLAPAKSPALRKKPDFDTTDAKLDSFVNLAPRAFALLRAFVIQSSRLRHFAPHPREKFDFTEKVELQH